jgi:hypothetical protein
MSSSPGNLSKRKIGCWSSTIFWPAVRPLRISRFRSSNRSATLMGIGIVIEKAFQGGGEDKGCRSRDFCPGKNQSLSPPKEIQFLD